MLINPFVYWAPVAQLGLLTLEAQGVIAMRLMGMAGIWSVAPGENKRMVSEKSEAFTRSVGAATRAALQGNSPNQILEAAVKPIRQKTRSNSVRLSKRGFSRHSKKKFF